MSDRDDVITWLQDAYAMETAIEEILAKHAKDAEEVPWMHERLQEHLEETRSQAERLKGCLESLDASPAKGKSAMGTVMGKMNGAMTGMYRDELVKNTLAEYATEHFEIACYKSLISAAERAGLPDIARICEDILDEEERMAEWLASQVDPVTHHYLDSRRSEEAA